MPKLIELMHQLEQLAPMHLAEKWDNIGLMIGKRQAVIDKVLCALDLTKEVVEEAISLGAQCIVTHHPFFFTGLKSLDLESPQGQLIETLIQHQIAVYSMHTNYDIAEGGLNDYLAQLLGLEQVKVLKTTYIERFSKVVTYVPATHLEAVREAIIEAKIATIGAYSGCTFTTQGEGTFIPLEGSQPYIGTAHTLEKVAESQISFIAPTHQVQEAIAAIKAVHPYEEVAIDVLPLENMEKKYGLGRYGVLPEPMQLDAFLALLKQSFKIEQLRITDGAERQIRRVALCSGAGSEFIADAARVADIYITGDLKYHEGQMAQAMGVCTVDVGHYASEAIALEPIRRCIQTAFPECQVYESHSKGETLLIR